jgi:hypothetical protein
VRRPAFDWNQVLHRLRREFVLTTLPPADRMDVTATRRRTRIAPALVACALLAGAASYAVPRGLEAGSLFAIEDDPGRIADRELAQNFNAARAAHEIEDALAADDADLARSFVELAQDRGITLDPALLARVNEANAKADSTQQALESFAMGFVTGEPKDAAGLAGTVGGDLFVFGDIRDAVREGSRFAQGEQVDELVLGLACVGLAITAATYASVGVATPARVGISLAKAARKTARLSGDLAAYIGRSLRRVIDGPKLQEAIAGASVMQPMIAMRAAKDAVKVERAGGLLNLMRDVGTVQIKAGTRAALDGLKVAGSPREMSRLARLAAEKGGKTRAILKVAGRGAIMLTFAAFNLAAWIFGAMFTLFGLVASLKSATERTTQRLIDRSKARRLTRQQRFAAMTARG